MPLVGDAVPLATTASGKVGGSVIATLAPPNTIGYVPPRKDTNPVGDKVSWLGEFTNVVRPVTLIDPLNPAAVQFEDSVGEIVQVPLNGLGGGGGGGWTGGSSPEVLRHTNPPPLLNPVTKYPRGQFWPASARF